MKRVFSHLTKKDVLYLIVCVVFILVQVYFTLRLPDYMDTITQIIKTDETQTGSILSAGLQMVLCAALTFVGAIVSGFCLAKVAASLSMNLRKSLFEKAMAFSLPEMNKFSASSLITRCTGDVMWIQSFMVMCLQVLIKAPVTAVIAVTKMRGVPQWLVYTVIAMTISMVLFIVLLIIVFPRSMRVQKLADSVNRVIREHLTGMRVVHAYNGYKKQRHQFEAVNEELTSKSIFVERMMGLLRPVVMALGNGLSVAIYASGAVIITNAASTEALDIFSKMVVFSSYALQVFAAFMMLLFMVTMIPRVMVSTKRINEVLAEDVRIKDGEKENGNESDEGSIEFKNVSFRYPGASADAVSNVSFKITKGQTMAIIGATGCGKTTLINLIPRLYDATSGQVLIDGVDVREYKLHSLRERIGYVPQKSFLFSGTIASNIDYGNTTGFQATLTDIKKAAEISQSKEFIELKEGKYNARVEQGGSNFSGGQRQRLTISRAVCRNPEFYLFDDSFSALDFKTDSTLRKKLKENAKDATQIIVGQRIGSIRDADLILVLDEGKVVGSGKHKELMESCEIYKEIALSQLSPSEVA